MADEHEKRIKRIEAECVEIRKQILQLEFQNKKDVTEVRKEADEMRKSIDRDMKWTTNHLRHVSQLAGITFEELDDLDERMQSVF